MEQQNAPSILISDPEITSTNTSSTTSFTVKNALQKLKTNLIFRSKWAELNGAMGDLGTYIPIVLALTLSRDLNFGTSLIFNGFYNIVTGIIYGVPMPVQPMKSIAAVALSDKEFGVPEIMAAGIITGGVLFILGITRLMKLVYKFIPLPVVRGIQLAQGLSFALTAVKYVRKVQDLPKSKALGQRSWFGLDGLILAIFCAVFILIVNGAGEQNHGCGVRESGDSLDKEKNDEEGKNKINKFKKIVFSLPSAFLVFMLGIVLVFIREPKVVNEIKFGPSSIEVVKFTKESWKKGFVRGAIPQLPMSILNSVIAVCKLSTDLFPEREFSVTSISVTVGLMNLIGCWFGVVPTCHGAGGLAGQYKFGGRSGGCVALLGATKMVLGLVLGTSLANILKVFPIGILGVLLLFAGIELAICARDMNSKEDFFIALVSTSFSLVLSSASLGFLVGMIVFVIFKVRIWTKDKSFSTIWKEKSTI